MLGDEGFVAADDGDRRLQRAADRKHRRDRLREPNRLWNIAACAADELRPPRDYRHDRVVRAGDDIAVMRDDQVGDAGKPPFGLVIDDHQRLAADWRWLPRSPNLRRPLADAPN